MKVGKLCFNQYVSNVSQDQAYIYQPLSTYDTKK